MESVIEAALITRVHGYASLFFAYSIYDILVGVLCLNRLSCWACPVPLCRFLPSFSLSLYPHPLFLRNKLLLIFSYHKQEARLSNSGVEFDSNGKQAAMDYIKMNLAVL